MLSIEATNRCDEIFGVVVLQREMFFDNFGNLFGDVNCAEIRKSVAEDD